MKKWMKRRWLPIVLCLGGVGVGRIVGTTYERQKARETLEAQHRHFGGACPHPERGNKLVDVRQCVGGIKHVYACGGWDLDPMAPEEAEAELRALRALPWPEDR